MVDFNKPVQKTEPVNLVTNKTEADHRAEVNKRMANKEDLQSFLQRISQELKGAQTTVYPPTHIRVADEIDAYIRKVGYEPQK